MPADSRRICSQLSDQPVSRRHAASRTGPNHLKGIRLRIMNLWSAVPQNMPPLTEMAWPVM